MIRFFKIYLPPLLWAGFIFWNSHRPYLDISGLNFPHVDKFGHFGVYLILGFLISRALCSGQVQNFQRKIMIAAIIIGSLYGASDEVHQLFVPGRSAEFADWLADTIGVFAAQLLSWWYAKKARIHSCNQTTPK